MTWIRIGDPLVAKYRGILGVREGLSEVVRYRNRLRYRLGMAWFDDAKYWICIREESHEDGTTTYTFRSAKTHAGDPGGDLELGLRAESGTFERDLTYDKEGKAPTSIMKGYCASPGCEERGVDLVRDEKGVVARACQEHAAMYREDAHDRGEHEGPENYDRLCPSCSTGLDRDPR